jgi:hypothetical protein
MPEGPVFAAAFESSQATKSSVAFFARSTSDRRDCAAPGSFDPKSARSALCCRIAFVP